VDKKPEPQPDAEGNVQTTDGPELIGFMKRPAHMGGSSVNAVKTEEKKD
jgi:cell division protein FtsZ